jgi:hypothetical protein
MYTKLILGRGVIAKSLVYIAATQMAKHRTWKSAAAGLFGTAAHASLMFLKSRTGLLPLFQPYQSLQNALSHWVGYTVHPIVPWLLSFLSGTTIIGFCFGRTYRLLPGKNGAIKGLVFGLFGWAMMGLLYYPLLGLGLFAIQIGLGIAPALFSLAMVLTYSVTTGVAYGALNSCHANSRAIEDPLRGAV